MAQKAGPGDEAIGRPPEVREGRYEKPGTPLENAVNKPVDPHEVPDKPSDR